MHTTLLSWIIPFLYGACIIAAGSTPAASHRTTHRQSLSPGTRAEVWTPIPEYYTSKQSFERTFAVLTIAWIIGAPNALWYIDQVCDSMHTQRGTCKLMQGCVLGLGALSMFTLLHMTRRYGSDELRSITDFVHHQTIYIHQDADTIPRIYDAHDARASVLRGANQIMQHPHLYDKTPTCSICHEHVYRTSSLLEQCKQYLYTTSQLDCGHMYHTSCIHQWMQQSHSCPLCRKVPRYGITHQS